MKAVIVLIVGAILLIVLACLKMSGECAREEEKRDSKQDEKQEEQKMQKELKIVYKQLDELQEYENNPRNNDGAVAAVAASIEKFGWKQPIVIDAAGVIIAGHTRAKAAAQLGQQVVPCVIADDLTEDEIRAYRLADNKTAELAGWEFDKLDAELEELAAVDFDMTEFGFEDFTLDDPQEVVEDEYEANVPENPYVQPRRGVAAGQTQTDVRG